MQSGRRFPDFIGPPATCKPPETVAFVICKLMFYTYILFSEKFDKYYIGFTHDLNGRLVAHNHPKNNGYTKRYQPWVIVFSKFFNTKKEAMDLRSI